MTFAFQMTFMQLPYFVMLSLRGNIVTVAIPAWAFTETVLLRHLFFTLTLYGYRTLLCCHCEGTSWPWQSPGRDVIAANLFQPYNNDKSFISGLTDRIRSNFLFLLPLFIFFSHSRASLMLTNSWANTHLSTLYFAVNPCVWLLCSLTRRYISFVTPV